MTTTVAQINDRLDHPWTTYDRYPYGTIRHADEGSIARAMRAERANDAVNFRRNLYCREMLAYKTFGIVSTEDTRNR